MKISHTKNLSLSLESSQDNITLMIIIGAVVGCLILVAIIAAILIVVIWYFRHDSYRSAEEWQEDIGAR